MSSAGSTTNLPPLAHESSSSDAAGPLQGERLPEDIIEKVSENVSEETSDANVMWVDWDGPEDPMNPKKYVVQLLFCPMT